MKIVINGIPRDMTEEEIKELEKMEAEYEKQERQRPLTESEVLTVFAKQQINTLSVDDNTALRMKSYYPTWQELVDANFTAEKLDINSLMVTTYTKLLKLISSSSLTGYPVKARNPYSSALTKPTQAQKKILSHLKPTWKFSRTSIT